MGAGLSRRVLSTVGARVETQRRPKKHRPTRLAGVKDGPGKYGPTGLAGR